MVDSKSVLIRKCFKKAGDVGKNVQRDSDVKLKGSVEEREREYIEVLVKGKTYSVVAYEGKLKKYTAKKTTSMLIPFHQGGKEALIVVDVIPEDRVIFMPQTEYQKNKAWLVKAARIELRPLPFAMR